MPQETLHQDFTTILVFLVFGAVFVITNMVAIGRLIRSKTKYTQVKSTAYECGARWVVSLCIAGQTLPCLRSA